MSKNGEIDKEALIEDIARKHGIDKEQAKKAIYSQFRHVKHVFEKAKYNAIRLPYFGIFKVKPKRYEHLKDQGIIPEDANDPFKDQKIMR